MPMTRIDFYHLQKNNPQEALSKLLEKAYALGKNILIKVGNENNLEEINTSLWTYEEQSFLPHGSKKDGNAALQPLWLTTQDDNPNNAVILFLIDNAKVDIDKLSSFERVLNIFDGQDNESLEWSRKLWKEAKNQGFECYYWQKDDRGAWQQKA